MGSKVKDLYQVGETPPMGTVPRRMLASVIRSDRYGSPVKSMVLEEVPTPVPGPEQVLVWVMAAGVNYNVVWAGLGRPVDVIAGIRRRGNRDGYFIGGSDASGIVWAVGERVRGVDVGDEVIVTGAQWDERADDIRRGADPTASDSTRVWGYEQSHGGLAQFALAEEHQVHPKPKALSWEDAGCIGVTAGTAYRQLFGWHPHTVQPGDLVLVWGGAGGLGVMAIQLVRAAGASAVAVVSDPAKGQLCRSLGAEAVIDRKDFQHWGRMPDVADAVTFRSWQLGVRKFEHALWDLLGQRRSPRIVLEHPGQDTLPTSIAVCARGGMVVTCAGTSGYNGDLDLRMLWMRQIRLQGSHMANTAQSRAAIELAARGVLDPCRTGTFPLADAGLAHQMLYEGTQTGNLAISVNADVPTRQSITTRLEGMPA